MKVLYDAPFSKLVSQVNELEKLHPLSSAIFDEASVFPTVRIEDLHEEMLMLHHP